MTQQNIFSSEKLGMKHYLLVACLSLLTLSNALGVSFCKDDQNIVTSGLAGKWRLDDEKTKMLSRDLESGEIHELTLFENDASAAFMGSGNQVDLCLYLAGKMHINKNNEHLYAPFVVVSLHGNMVLVFQKESGGLESNIITLARGDDRADDILYVGGHSNNQGMMAYVRIKF